MRTPTATLVTFGDGAGRYRRAARRLEREAARIRWFTEVHRWDARRLQRELPDFYANHATAMRPGSRGFGYWIWKPIVMSETLRRSTADVVLFLDAGCVLNPSAASTRRMERYLTIAFDRGVLATQLEFSEQQYTKGDLLERLAVRDADRISGQFQSGIVFLRRDAQAMALCDEWLTVAEEADYHYLDDSASTTPNSEDFVAHRHDQSILSCLLKARDAASITDETFFDGDWKDAGATFPIWAPRHTWGSPFSPDGSPSVMLKLERRLLR